MICISSFCIPGISSSSRMIEKEKERKTETKTQDEREARKKEKESSVDLTRGRKTRVKNSLTMPGAVVNNEVGYSAFLPCVLFRDAGWVVHGGNKRQKKREREGRCLRPC